jgi:hypothetical protein
MRCTLQRVSAVPKPFHGCELSESSLCDVDVESGWPGHRRGFRSLGIRDGSIVRRRLALRTCRTAKVGSDRVLQALRDVIAERCFGPDSPPLHGGDDAREALRDLVS